MLKTGLYQSNTWIIVRAVFAFLACWSAVRAADDANWPMFRGGPTLNGVLDKDLPETLEVLWRFSRDAGFLGSAAIVDGAVYIGADDGNLYALSLNDGAVKWTYETESLIESSPLVLGDTVYYGDEDGVFHAVDKRSGKGRWTFKTEGQIISSANHVDDHVVFGSYDGSVYCLASDGKLVWKCETRDRIHGTPGVIRKHVFQNGEWRDEVYCLVAGCDENMHVIDTASGKEIRGINMGSVSGASAAVRSGRVYVGTYGNQVVAMDWESGKIVWTYENEERQFPYMSSAAVTDKLVIIGGRDKRVRALDVKTGRQRWEFVTRARVDSSPVVAGQSVFVGSSDGNLYRLNLADGQEKWRFEAASPISASPAIASGRLVIGTVDGVLYCFGDPASKNGRQNEAKKDNHHELPGGKGSTS